jgi:hypothetical protein
MIAVAAFAKSWQLAGALADPDEAAADGDAPWLALGERARTVSVAVPATTVGPDAQEVSKPTIAQRPTDSLRVMTARCLSLGNPW